MATVSQNAEHSKKAAYDNNDEKEFHYELPEPNEMVNEGNEAYNDQQRDDIINDYINKLEDKANPSEKIIYDDNDPIDEEDLFEKAEAEYKQSNKTKSIITHKNDEHIDYNFNSYFKHQQYDHSKDLFLRSNHNPNLIYKHPEVLYQKEINQLKKMQSIRKKYTHIYHALPSLKIIEHASEGDIDKSLLVNISSNIRIIPGMSYSPINKNKYATELLVDKEKRAMRNLNDPKNPYSNDWHNHILKSRYNFKIQVNGFINGIPQLKLKKVPIELPNVNNITHSLEAKPKKKFLNKIKSNEYNEIQGTNKSSIPFTKKRNRIIEYPYILRHFKHGKSKSCG